MKCLIISLAVIAVVSALPQGDAPHVSGEQPPTDSGAKPVTDAGHLDGPWVELVTYADESCTEAAYYSYFKVEESENCAEYSGECHFKSTTKCVDKPFPTEKDGTEMNDSEFLTMKIFDLTSDVCENEVSFSFVPIEKAGKCVLEEVNGVCPFKFELEGETLTLDVFGPAKMEDDGVYKKGECRNHVILHWGADASHGRKPIPTGNPSTQ
jgi:hypothetical protein